MTTSNADEEVFLQCVFNKTAHVSNYGDYLKYYNEEIHSLSIKQRRQYDEGDPRQRGKPHEHAAKNVADMVLITKLVAASPDSCRSCVRDILRIQKRFENERDAALDNSVNLALRLMLMLNVRWTSWSRPDTAALQWSEEDTLTAFVTQQFPLTSELMSSQAANRMDDDFTAIGLQKYRGIEIRWTSSLEDHLRLKYDRQSRTKRLKVFPFKRLLIDHLKLTGTEVMGPSILPKLVVKETVWTLDLLFPRWDQNTQSFLKKEKQIFQDVLSPESAPLEFWHYRHWRARLVELHNEFHAPPPGLLATLRDYRNPVQWWTFWLAVVIAVETFAVGVIALVLAGLTLRDTCNVCGMSKG